MTAPHTQCQPEIDTVSRAEMIDALAEQRRRMGAEYDALFADRQKIVTTAKTRIEELEQFVSWVETWTANPISAYSVFALDGLFGMTRDKIAALRAKA